MQIGHGCTAQSQREPEDKSEVVGARKNLVPRALVREIARRESHSSQGNATSNLTLSEQRANAVRTYLTSKGVALGTLTAKGYGSTKPVAGSTNATTEDWAKNRRITLTVQGGAN